MPRREVNCAATTALRAHGHGIAPFAVASSPFPARTSEKCGASALISSDAANCGLSDRHAPQPIEWAIAMIGLPAVLASASVVHA